MKKNTNKKVLFFKNFALIKIIIGVLGLFYSFFTNDSVVEYYAFYTSIGFLASAILTFTIGSFFALAFSDDKDL